MVVQAAIVHVDGSARGQHVVRHAHLAVAEARRVLKNAYAATDEVVVVRPRQAIHHLLVRDARRDNAHVNATTRGKPQGMLHLVGNDEVRGDKPGIVLRIFGNRDIDVLSHGVVVHRVVGVGLHKALGVRVGQDLRQVPPEHGVVHVTLSRCVPHLKESRGQVLHSRSHQLDAGILPMPVGVCEVEVLVGDVVAASKANMAVDHGNLAVVAVVKEEVEARHEGVEHLGLDALGLEALHEVGVDEADGAHVVIEDAHLDARADALLQNVLDGPPALGILDGVVLHKDEVLGAAQLLLLRLDTLGGVIVVGDGRVVIQRVRGGLAQVAGDVCRAVIHLVKAREGCRSVRQQGEELRVNLLKALAHPKRAAVQARKQIEARAKDGQRHDGDDPGHLHGRRRAVVIYVEDEHRAQQAHTNGKPLSLLGKPEVDEHDDCQLQHNCYASKNETLDAVLDVRFLLKRGVLVHEYLPAQHDARIACNARQVMNYRAPSPVGGVVLVGNRE